MDSGNTRTDLFVDISALGVASWIVLLRVMTCYLAVHDTGPCCSIFGLAIYLITLIPIVVATIPAVVVIFFIRPQNAVWSIVISSVAGLTVLVSGMQASSLLYLVLFLIGLPLVDMGRHSDLQPFLAYAPLIAPIWGCVVGTLVSQHWRRSRVSYTSTLTHGYADTHPTGISPYRQGRV
jgi:hypothetical protein